MRKRILLENLDLIMDEDEFKKIMKMNNEGFGVYEIAEAVNRDPYEVIAAILDSCRTNRVLVGPIWGFK